jgi:hypothetical protein
LAKENEMKKIIIGLMVLLTSTKANASDCPSNGEVFEGQEGRKENCEQEEATLLNALNRNKYPLGRKQHKSGYYCSRPFGPESSQCIESADNLTSILVKCEECYSLYDKKKAAEDAAQEQQERDDEQAKQDKEKALTEWIKPQLKQLAIKSGYLDVNYDEGILETINKLKQGNETLNNIKKVPVKINENDNFKILQVYDQNNILLVDEDNVVIWLHNYAKNGGQFTAIEGGNLFALGMHYAAIAGIKTYTTAMRGTKQAIVIEKPHWNKSASKDFDKKLNKWYEENK